MVARASPDAIQVWWGVESVVGLTSMKIKSTSNTVNHVGRNQKPDKYFRGEQRSTEYLHPLHQVAYVKLSHPQI